MSYHLKVINFRITTISFVKYYSKSINSNLLNILTNMPKDRKHVADAQKQRNKIKEKFCKYVPGKVSLQVLGTGAKGSPRSLYIFSDQSRYLFNCGEGTQRLAHEHKMRLAKLEHIFITQPVWTNIGGLPGTALTIQDVGVPQITLHGPPGLVSNDLKLRVVLPTKDIEEIFMATRRFVVLKDLTIRMADCSENSLFEDNVMKIQYIPLLRTVRTDSIDLTPPSPSEKNESENSTVKGIQVDQEMSDASTATKRSRKCKPRSRSVSPDKPLVEEDEDDIDYYAHEHSGRSTTSESISLHSQSFLQEAKEMGVCMSYICRLQPRPGALNLDACVRKGVPPGPLLGKLKNGEDITLADGTVVKSVDVCEPDDLGPVFIVVDCPSVDYISSLVSNEKIQQCQEGAVRQEDVCDLVIHFSAQDVIDHPVYKQWMDRFSLSTQHLILNETNTCMGSESVHRIQHKLNLLSSDIFPLLGDQGSKISLEEVSAPVTKKLKNEASSNGESKAAIPMENLSVSSRSTSPEQMHVFANTLCTYHLRPKKGFDRDVELQLSPKLYVTETMGELGMPTMLFELRQKMQKAKMELTIGPYPKLLFLGTGSCIPNKTRNTSGILLTTSENRHILVDCGEGTCGQIVRFFGREKCNNILANVDAVYVSHLHADHHIGLIGLLQGRAKAIQALNIKKPPLFLFAPKQIVSWLNFYDRCFENIKQEYRLISNGDLIHQNHTLDKELEDVAFESLDMTDISTCLVKHCPNAYGVCFLHKDGFKITYSGDTMPVDSLVLLGKNSDILIHEATMEDELVEEAVIKMHSTTSQAIEIGHKMDAKNILLTHFSQRYAKLPRFNDNFAENVGIAFDNMQVRLDELPLVSLLYPALKLMFAEHYEELEHKAVKRQLRLERQREASVNRKKENV